MRAQRHKTMATLRIVLFSPNRHFSGTKWQTKKAARLVKSCAACVQVIFFYLNVYYSNEGSWSRETT